MYLVDVVNHCYSSSKIYDSFWTLTTSVALFNLKHTSSVQAALLQLPLRQAVQHGGPLLLSSHQGPLRGQVVSVLVVRAIPQAETTVSEGAVPGSAAPIHRCAAQS